MSARKERDLEENEDDPKVIIRGHLAELSKLLDQVSFGTEGTMVFDDVDFYAIKTYLRKAIQANENE